jgi:hypothetical protein
MVSTVPKQFYLKTVPSSASSTAESLECVFKSMAGFEDEMHRQWKALITKYELVDSGKISLVKPTSTTTK